MYIRLIFNVMLFVLLTPLALSAQVWSASVATDFATLTPSDGEKDKPIVQSPKQIGDDLQLQWSSSFVKINSASFEIRLYEAIEDANGNIAPNLAQKPIVADIVKDRQYRVNGKDLNLRHGQNYCFVIAPSDGFDIKEGVLPDNAAVSEGLVWKNFENDFYPICTYTPFDMEVTNASIDALTLEWKNTAIDIAILNEFVFYLYEGNSLIPTIYTAANIPMSISNNVASYSRTFTGLKPNTLFSIKMKANCLSGGLSQNFGTSKAETNIISIGKTLHPCGNNVTVTVDYSDECGTKVSWINKIVNQYNNTLESLEVSLDNGTIVRTIPLQNYNRNFYIFEDLAEGPGYTFSVISHCTYNIQKVSAINSNYSEVVAGCSNPAIPFIDACKIKLTWDNPNNLNCIKIIATSILDNTSKEYDLSKSSNPVVKEFEIEDLVEGKTYTFDLIYACNAEIEKTLSFPSITAPISCKKPRITGIVPELNNSVKINYDGSANLSVCYVGQNGANSSGGSVLYKKGDTIPYIQPTASYILYIAYEGCPNNCTSQQNCTKSEIEVIPFTMPCVKPLLVYYKKISSQSIKIAWEESLPATVEYREAGTATWSSPVLATNNFELNNVLTPNTSYEFKVAYSNCNNPAIVTFKTPATDICLGNPLKSEISYHKIDRNSIQLNIRYFNFNNEYECEYKEANNPGSTWTAGNILNEANKFTLSSLVAGTTYNFRLRRLVYGSSPTPCAWLELDDFTTEDLVCPLLVLLDIQYETGDSYIKITWRDGKNPKSYQIRYRIEGTTEWGIINAQGLTCTINELLNNTTYEMGIRRVCSDANTDWVALDKTKTKTKKITTVPEPDCGLAVKEPIPPAGLTIIPPIDQLSKDDIFYYNGFEIKVTELSNGQQSTATQPFSGKGEMGLPFGKKKIKVNFSNMNINKIQLGTGGSITAVSDRTLNIQGSTVAINTFTCTPPPVNLTQNPDNTYGNPPKAFDSHGFDKDGKYIGTIPPCFGANDQKDLLRDPRGFNKAGDHLNGTKYDAGGCDINGLKADKQPCACFKPCDCKGIKPYAWLNDNADITNEGSAFADAQKDQIKIWIPIILDSLKQNLTTQIAIITASCGALRVPMNTQLPVLGYNRPLTFGTDDKYFKEQMSAEFNKTPAALTGNTTDRKTGADVFEKNHIDLYACDLKLADAEKFQELVNFFYSTPLEREKINNFVYEKARRLSKEKVEEFKSVKKFKVWVVEQIMEFLKNEFRTKYGRDFGYIEPQLMPNNEPGFPPLQKPWIQPYQKGLANTELSYGLLKDATTNDINDAVFQYEQGWEYINGVHRTVFYEAIAKTRQEMEMVDDAQAMPISFGKTIAEVNYTMYLDNFAFNGSTASIDAYMVITLKDGQKVVFKGTGLAFNRNGLISTATSGPKLFLLTDVAYGINRVARIKLKGLGGQTYVEWDCDGFRALHTKVDVEFCRQYMKPLDNNGNVTTDPDEMVTLSTALEMKSWGEFEATIAADQEMNFVMTGYEDYKINVKQIIIDNSTTMMHNTNIVFPENYGSKDVEITGTAPTATAKALASWKGIFIGGISVKLPANVIKSKNGQVKVGVEKMIIDNEGVTGIIGYKPANPIVPIDDGDLDGWAYSVDKIHLNVMQNHIVGGGFDGLLNIPILSDKDQTGNMPKKITPKDCFHYRADYIVGLNKFTFTVKPESAKVFNWDMLKAKVTLNQNSRVDLILQNNSFVANAVLHGTIAMGGKFDPAKPKRNLGVFSIGFQDLAISNKAPRFKGGHFAMPKDPQLFKKYGLTYHTGAVRSSASDDKIAIMDLDVDFHLSKKAEDITVTGGGTTTVEKGKDPTELKAHGGFEIRGIMENDEGGRQRFVYQKFAIKRAEVNGSFAGVAKIHGYIKFFEEGDMIDNKPVDPRYGEGFQGGLDVKFDKLGFQAQAVGLFGTVDDYKYFCVDAMIYKDGLFNIAGVMDVNGFGGGAYYHMSRDTAVVNNLNFTMDKDTPIPTEIGVSLTGIKYAPDKDKLIGIRAMIAFSLPKSKTAANGNLLFGVEFNKDFGLSAIMMAGNVNFMTPIKPNALPKFLKDKGDPKTAAIRASIALALKFGKDPEFHCNTSVYMNVTGGLLVGDADPVNRPELMGDIDILVKEGKWHFNIGTPVNPVSLSMKIPNTPQFGFSIKTYIDIGNDLGDMPPLPDFIQKATGSGYNPTKSATRNSGAGFAFGASLNIDAGEKEFLIFYGEFKAEVGFDVMLKDYGKTTTCSNFSNNPIGMDGWYATGQLYAGVKAKLGLKWKKSRFPIMDIYAGVALQAKLPNPFWAQGNVGGYYSILGGLKKGNCNFQMTIGEECTLPQTLTGGEPSLLVAKENIISSITPLEGEEAFPVLSSPIIEFNYPLDEILEDDNTGKKYVAEFIEEPVLKTKDGYTIPFKKEYYDGRTRIEIQPYSILDGNTEMELSFTVHLKENGAEVTKESKVVHFKTAGAEMTLPSSNIISTYPQGGQHNFYLKEVSEQKGYIHLRLGQPYLFRPTEGGKAIVHKMKFTAKSGACFMTNIEYNNTTGEPLVIIDMPSAKFQKGELYRMDLITIAADDSPTACVPDAKVIRNLYTSYFRTSTYEKVSDKINAAFAGQTQTNGIAPDYKVTLPKANPVEPFDQYEVLNFGKLQSAFKFTASYTQFLPATYLSGLNKVTGKEPYVVEYEIKSGDIRKYILSLDFSNVSGNRSLRSGQREVTDLTAPGAWNIPRYLKIIQEQGTLPYIKPSDFTGTFAPFTEPQYLRFDAVKGTWEQLEALKKGIINLKEDIVQDLIAAKEYTTNEKADAMSSVESNFADKDSEYNWIDWISEQPVFQQTGKIPATAIYTPATRNNVSSEIEFNK